METTEPVPMVHRGHLRELCAALGLVPRDVIKIEITQHVVVAQVLQRDASDRVLTKDGRFVVKPTTILVGD